MYQTAADTLTEPSADSSLECSFLSLPVELLTLIVEDVDLPSFLALARTSRGVRAHVMRPYILDTVARGEFWFWPGRGSASQSERCWWDRKMKELKTNNPDELRTGYVWRYLNRCYDTPSMLNRRRIWGCVQRIEKRILEFEADPTPRSPGGTPCSISREGEWQWISLSQIAGQETSEESD